MIGIDSTSVPSTSMPSSFLPACVQACVCFIQWFVLLHFQQYILYREYFNTVEADTTVQRQWNPILIISHSYVNNILQRNLCEVIMDIRLYVRMASSSFQLSSYHHNNHLYIKIKRLFYIKTYMNLWIIKTD